MDKIKKKRTGARKTITKIIGEVEQELAKAKTDIDQVLLRVKLERLDQLNENIQLLDTQVLDGLYDSNAAENALEDEQSKAEEYLENIATIRIKINMHLETDHAVTVKNDDTTSVTNTRRFKLPKAEYKLFSGELKEWLGWWAWFQKIDQDESIDPADKFDCLLRSTVPGSRAREAVASYPESAENYPKVIERVKQRFGNAKLLKQYYVRELLKLITTSAKGTCAMSTLYYSLDSHTRALATLGVTTEQAAEFLYPMVESCLPEDLLIVWQRHPNYMRDGTSLNPPVSELSYLLDFLRIEVENEEQRALAKGESYTATKPTKCKKSDKNERQDDVATSAGLFSAKEKCIFCDKTNHQSQECLKALSMTLEDKRKKVNDAKGSCYVCFKKGCKKPCKAPVKCSLCARKHYHVMCPDLPALKQAQAKFDEEKKANQSAPETSIGNSGIVCGGEVLLKTVLVRVKGKDGVQVLARLLFDEGSQASYITTYVINQIKSKSVGAELVRNVMIDGTVSGTKRFYKHNVTLLKSNGSELKLRMRERPVIGGVPPRAHLEKWRQQLLQHGIKIEDHADVNEERAELDLLIGNDYREMLMTGKRVQLSVCVFAVESVFGWILSGPVENTVLSATETVIHSYLTGDITQLWTLDTLGIRDPAEKASLEEVEIKVKEDFLKQVTREVDGRYVVKLPWINEEMKSHLPTNANISARRLQTTTTKLKKQGKFDAYDAIFRGWEHEGIIEVINDDGSGHYLPHRPVFKDSVTTPVRPVFDASCHSSKSPSLNQCLEKGPNWLELIPSILIRFRQKKIGVISDIRKAFQMIAVDPEDRKYQKFFWWDENGKMKTYQHCRVVFGMTCSPFILAAILDLHLSEVKNEWKETASLLKTSLYVDNCVTAFDEEGEYRKFKHEAIEILSEAKMELRQWESKLDPFPVDQNTTTVLGLKWDKTEDTLYCQVPKGSSSEHVTKRLVLSSVSQIYDPIGYASPALLPPKLLLQESWATDLGWDEEWDEDSRSRYLLWQAEAEHLEKIRIPRNAFGSGTGSSQVQLHVFTDASQFAYGAVVFVRVVRDTNVSVQLLNAKSRVAPIDKKKSRVTIPRLELLGCLIGARLGKATKEALKLDGFETQFWSDSTTALAWIKRQEDWGTFVGRRVAEIVKLTQDSNWRHVPGMLNPADLPSRGCSPSELLASKWWEGPSWLKLNERAWPSPEDAVDDELVNSETRKTVLSAVQVELIEPRFSSYLKNVRVAGWARSFLHNCKLASEERVKNSFLFKKERLIAEADLFKDIQKRHFGTRPNLKSFNVNIGEDGLIKVKSRLTFKTDTDDFKNPILLPKNDPLVHQLIHHIHRTETHAGTQIVLGKLRERYWMPQGRKTVGKILQQCTVCKRHGGKCFQTDAAPLPKDRVETMFAFQTTGVDLTGPLILKGGEKAWIVLFTCAVYRGIHLDLVTSLSTEAFLSCLERFISTIGRPNRIYSDNGTNFVGAKNLMKLLNWTEIEEEFQLKEINWTFNPPAAPWWGGWWERMVRSTKELLRRMLGTAKLTYEELLTCLHSVAGTINDRPLTTLTEDNDDLTPLTPRMFMRDLPIAGFPEGLEIGAIELRGAYRKQQVLKESLKSRFRKEYLAMLVQKGGEKASTIPKVGDVVLVGMDNKKRFEWPLGRIVELGPGKDGKVRVATVKMASSPKTPNNFKTKTLTRPLRCLYPLEMSSTERSNNTIPIEVVDNVKHKQKKISKLPKLEKVVEIPIQTRSGRIVKKTQHYNTWNF